MNILIIGAGAIGGSLAAMLANSGQSVTLLEKNKDIYEKIKEKGIVLTTAKGAIVARPEVIRSIEDAPVLYDCCFVATRAYHLKRAVFSAMSVLVGDAPVISMNNGVCIDQLATLIGEDRALACAINYGVGISAPGEYYVKIEGGLVLGSRSGQVNSQVIRIAKILNCAVKCTVTENIIGALYSKMLINSCITSVAVMSGLKLGQILETESGKLLFDTIIKEGIEVAERADIKVPSYNGKLNYYRVLSPSLFGRIYRYFAYRSILKKYGQRTSATLEALKRGVPTETAYFNGYIAGLGQKYGVETPVNTAITASIAMIEKDLSLISPKRIDEIVRIALRHGEDSRA